MFDWDEMPLFAYAPYRSMHPCSTAWAPDLWLDREHGVQAPLPLVLIHDFEGYDLIAHGRDEIRPVLLGSMFRADVEYAASCR